MKTRIISALYFLSGFTFILLQYLPGSRSGLVIKALIIPLLIAIFLVNIQLKHTASHWLMLFALLFSWAGDIALELPRQTDMTFMTGLSCFLLTHVLYCLVFFLTPGKVLLSVKSGIFFLLAYLYGAVLLYFLLKDLGNMFVPVAVYTVVLLTMLAAAISRYKKVSKSSYLLVLIGAMLFVLSDSLLAINKFSLPLQGSSLWIMSTYVAGQYLIVMGNIRQFRTTA